MNLQDALSVTSSRFVVDVFQERFVHEALKKPQKLMGRISHSISEVFGDRFKNGKCKYQPEDDCFLFEKSGRSQKSTWSEAMTYIENHGGGGYLIIDAKGNRFYAQSEGFPPRDVYAGSI